MRISDWSSDVCSSDLAPSRMSPEDFGQWYVRNAQGEMVPFSAFSSGHWTYGPPKLERYNGIPSVEILGQPAPGLSTGEAMAEVEALLKQDRKSTRLNSSH